MSNLLIILFFLIWKILDTWIVFLSKRFIPFAGFFPYNRQLFDFGLPQLISALANFDGIHYLLIAHRGYAQWEQAFFPLYPLLIGVINPIFHNELITGLLISNVAFLIGLVFLFKLLKTSSSNIKRWVLIFLLAFPTSFFFSAVYTEGLFFMLFVLTLYYLKRNNYRLMTLFAMLAAMTRLIGIFLVIPIAFHLLENYQTSKIKYQKYILNIKNLFLAAPFIGLGIYCFYLWKTTGDPLFFLTSQPVFGANRSTHLIFLPQVAWRYIKIFSTASHNFQYYVSWFEFIVFFLVFTVLIFDLIKHLKFTKSALWRIEIKNYDRLALNLFSFANLILPTLTGTFSSIPRYALFSVSFFIILAEIKNRSVKIAIALLFFIFHVLILSLFGLGYFIS